MSDNCDSCGDSTAFGSGKFVNRLPSDDGWRCADCLAIECDRCGKDIYLDEDYTGWMLHEDWDEFPDGSTHIHYECLTKDDLIMLISQLSCKVTEARSEDDLVEIAYCIQNIAVGDRS
jgi:hypothetical protein